MLARWRETPATADGGLRIVALGGGTGLPAVLSGLASARAAARRQVQVSAVVTTADDGGSSGELRRLYGVPSPGDVRNCLVALAPGAQPLTEVFQHRFHGDGGLTGHTVGNLVLTALAQQLGDFSAAVAAAGHMLHARGRVVPAHAETPELEAHLADGRVIRGESAIGAARGQVKRLCLARPAPASQGALEAVAAAHVVVLGPGSLYSSVIACLLGDGMAEALRRSSALKVMVVNLFTQPGETDGYDAAEHVRAVVQHAGPVVDLALGNDAPLPPPMLERYAAEGARPVAFDREALNDLGVGALTANLLAPGDLARHDPGKLGEVLLELSRTR
ncbi:MAG TPA: gluconeogenesis factor YvcK family protein [Anaeromyxobacteraceae bacterium]|nr:gluconeogenesis factor YvcK family protein [Anaeromyxobacteraceae bacterium]